MDHLMSLDTTIAAYRHLVETPSLLDRCGEAARSILRTEAQETLAPLLQPFWHGDVATTLDFSFLFSLLRKDFRGQMLVVGLDLSHLDLDGATFAEAEIEALDFSFCSLRGAIFDQATFQQVQFTNCHARHSSWLDVELAEVDFDKAHLEETHWRIASCGQAVTFCQAHLTRACFSDSRLQAVAFPRARMAHTRFSTVDVSRSDFTEADLSFSQAKVLTAHAALFDQATLIGACWKEALLGQADFDEAALAGVDLTEAFLSHANFSQADLHGACLTKVRAPFANFSHAILTRANLDGAWLAYAVLDEASLYGTNLCGIVGYGAFLGSMLLVDADTVLPETSHLLIGKLLEGQAATWQERQFAAGVQVTPQWCWEDFAEQLQKTPTLLSWACRVLSSLKCFQSRVEQEQAKAQASRVTPDGEMRFPTTPLPDSQETNDDSRSSGAGTDA
jgi:uncharacterized protein YjbI with pentapeptide repeats